MNTMIVIENPVISCRNIRRVLKLRVSVRIEQFEINIIRVNEIIAAIAGLTNQEITIYPIFAQFSRLKP